MGKKTASLPFPAAHPSSTGFAVTIGPLSLSCGKIAFILLLLTLVAVMSRWRSAIAGHIVQVSQESRFPNENERIQRLTEKIALNDQPPPPPPPPPESPTGKWKNLINVAIDEGMDLGTERGVTLPECREKCDAKPGCLSAAYAPSIRECYLKDKQIEPNAELKLVEDFFTTYK